MTEEIEKYANHINANEEILNWLKTTGKKSLIKKLTNNSELEHVLDFFISDAAPKRLQKMSIKDAKRKANEWMNKNKKKGRNLTDCENDVEMIYGFEDGSMIVRLKTKKAYQREGYLMSHCLGGYDSNNSDCFIYSYRDIKNKPHATFEVRKEANEIIQIKGKGNGSIHPKYINPILIFLEYLGIKIRPTDMKNIGYYHIDKVHIDFLNEIPGAKAQITEINGESYAR